jgi:hypothetical protein
MGGGREDVCVCVCVCVCVFMQHTLDEHASWSWAQPQAEAHAPRPWRTSIRSVVRSKNRVPNLGVKAYRNDRAVYLRPSLLCLPTFSWSRGNTTRSPNLQHMGGREGMKTLTTLSTYRRCAGSSCTCTNHSCLRKRCVRKKVDSGQWSCRDSRDSGVAETVETVELQRQWSCSGCACTDMLKLSRKLLPVCCSAAQLPCAAQLLMCPCALLDGLIQRCTFCRACMPSEN